MISEFKKCALDITSEPEIHMVTHIIGDLTFFRDAGWVQVPVWDSGLLLLLFTQTDRRTQDLNLIYKPETRNQEKGRPRH